MIPAGTEGTTVGVHGEGARYVVESAEPAGALVTVLPGQIRPAAETGQ